MLEDGVSQQELVIAGTAQKRMGMWLGQRMAVAVLTNSTCKAAQP